MNKKEIAKLRRFRIRLEKALSRELDKLMVQKGQVA